MFTVSYERPDLKALSKDSFVADMHYHTAYSHDCKTPVRDILKLARKNGLSVAFTDHNRIGGVREARSQKNVLVIPAVELCSKEGKEVIPYFYDAGQLEDFYARRVAPRLKDKNPMRSARTPIKMVDLLAWLAEEECVVTLPHPFALQPRKSHPFFTNPKRDALLRHVHALEVFNSQEPRRSNLSATGWAVQLRKGVTAGSDGHLLHRLGAGVVATNATTIEEHLNAVRKARVAMHGLEMKAHERAWNYARTSVKNKLQNGVRSGLQKGLSFPARVSRRVLRLHR